MSLIAFALAAALSPAMPDPAAETVKDMRCVALIAVQVSETTDPQTKAQLSAGMMYFIGRIDGRSPGYDLEGALVALVKAAPPPAETEADRKRCSDMLIQRGTSLVEMGNRISAM